MNDRLRILLTNIWLADFAGSEVVTRDLALGLLRRGHRPIVYTPKLGDVAAEIAARGVPVVDDLRQVAERPDVIHAHHVIPCGEALIRFPDVPAIQTCQAFESWIEGPAHFPQIGAYVAIDEACRDRLVQREGIAPERVVLLPNAVDLRRVPPRPQPLSERPMRALAFGKASAVAQLRTACERLGIEYEAIGRQVGRPSAEPEQELVRFDLVFASARAALEALCCGCAVIVCDARGFGGRVTSQNFASMRMRNFGLRCLGEPVTVERCVDEIGLYDRADASRVAGRARREADLEQLLDAFEKLYAEVLTGSRRPRMDASAHAQAVARFLHENLPRRPEDGRWPWLAEKHDLEAFEDMASQLAAMRASLARIEQERDARIARLETRVADQERQTGAATSALAQARAELQARDDALRALYGSTSWKATAPLRRIARWTRENRAVPARIIRLERIAQGSLAREPYQWAFVNDLFSRRVGNALARTYPHDHYKTVRGCDREKGSEYEARPLIQMNATTVSYREGLSKHWQMLADDLLSPAYRTAVSRLTGRDLSAVPMEAYVCHYDPETSIEPHVDLADEIVTHVVYFNADWNEADGGCLQILRAPQTSDPVDELMPIVGNSAILVRAENAWHAVAKASNGCRSSRRSMNVIFYHPGAVSTVWPPGEHGPLHDYPQG